MPRAGRKQPEPAKESAVKTQPGTTSAQPSLPCVVHGIGWLRSHRLAARELKREAAQAHRICREPSQGHKPEAAQSN